MFADSQRIVAASQGKTMGLNVASAHKGMFLVNALGWLAWTQSPVADLDRFGS